MRNATLAEGAIPINKRKPVPETLNSSRSAIEHRTPRGAQSNIEVGTAREDARPTIELPTPISEIPPGNWADFLASKPEERTLQFAIIQEIAEKIAAFRPLFQGMVQQTIATAESGRQIGIAVVELEERLPGKKLTEDFWRQMEALFNAHTGQMITRDMLAWFAKIARKHLNPITTLQEAIPIQQELRLASGEAEFQLSGQRAPQVAHAPPPPLAEFKEMFNFNRMQERWNLLKADGTSFVGGRLRPDLREVLRVEFERPVQLFEEIKRELGF